MSETIKIDVHDRKHIFLMGVAAGLRDAHEALEKLPDSVKGTPGVALCAATIAAQLGEYRAEIAIKNLNFVAKAGHQIHAFKTIAYDPQQSAIVAEPYEPDLFSEQAD